MADPGRLMSPKPPGRAIFTTGWGVVLTTAGAAIGLGNIWRFPYMMGEYGGSAFLAVYLIFVVAFGIPGLMAECALGRHTRRGPAGAFQAVSMPGANWWSGVILLTMFMAGAYYAVILGDVLAWGLAFARAAVTSEPVAPSVPGSFQGRCAFLLVTFALTGIALGFGLRRGIERLSTVGLPVFFVMFVALIVYVLRLEGSLDGLRQFLVPRLGNVTPATGLAAMGQAFFSLGLAGSLMVMYGSHLRQDDSIPATAIGTAAADVAAALLAGMIVVPAVFALGKELAAGPTLMFQVLPEVFAGMPLGGVIGAVFFLAVFLVGLLSLIGAAEVLVGAAVDALEWPRPRAVAVVCGASVVLAVPAVLSNQYIRWSDLIWGSTMMPLGSVLAVVALAWFVSRARALEEIGRGSGLPVSRFLHHWLKYVLPVGITTMLVYGWIDWVIQQRGGSG